MDGDGGGMDPCECIGHEIAMRRLLNLLRQTQSYCTDTECFQDVIASGNQNQDQNFFLFSLLIAFAMIMYFLRPRNFIGNALKGNANNDRNDSPPNPPSPVL